MKKKLFLTAGILIGMGSVYGARHFFASVSAGNVSVTARPEFSQARAVEMGESNAAAGDSLSARIERLRRWVCGEERSLDRYAALKILEEWAARDPRAALDFVGAAPRFPRRNRAYAVALAGICRAAPKEASDWLAQQVAVVDDRMEIASAIVKRIEDDAPVATLEFVNAMSFPIELETLGSLLGRVARTQPQMALQAFAQKRAAVQEALLGPMLRTWAQTNPNEALAWYLARGSADSDAGQSLAAGCMKSGQYKLADLVQRLNLKPVLTDGMLWGLRREGVAFDAQELGFFSERSRRRAAHAAARELEESPEKVVAFVKAAVGAEEQAVTLLAGWRSWLESDRKGAQEWLQQLPDRRLANGIRAQFERQEQMKDPRKALTVVSTIANQKERKEAVAQAVQRLCWEDPAAAATWLAQNPNEAPLPNMFGELAERYLERDDAGAMAWIAGLSSGVARDEALSAAAIFWGEREVEFATASMAVIGDVQKRQQCMFRLYRNLNRTNAAKADQWLAAQGLPAEVRQSWKALGQSGSNQY